MAPGNTHAATKRMPSRGTSPKWPWITWKPSRNWQWPWVGPSPNWQPHAWLQLQHSIWCRRTRYGVLVVVSGADAVAVAMTSPPAWALWGGQRRRGLEMDCDPRVARCG